MKRIKQFLCAAAALCLLLTLMPAARAAYGEETFEGKTWEEVVAGLMDEYHVDPERVAMGYYNTVTGETHYHRGDQYMVAASMYKVPLNMVFTERIANGEMDWTSIVGGYRYERVLEMSIVNSDNEISETLWNRLGGYQKYRKAICPYMGVDPDTVDRMYWKNNYFTAEQMIHCLSMLHAEPERFPRMEETMMKAEPERYFKSHPQDFEIAHKYGRVADSGFYYLNDCAICYTDEPICIVLFTASVGSRAQDFMADFCTLMCDYAQYHTAQRQAEEDARAIEAAAAALVPETGFAALSEGAVPAGPALRLEDAAEGRLVDLGTIAPSFEQYVLCAVIAAAALVALICAIHAALRGKVTGVWAVLTVLLTTAALGLGVMAPTLSEWLNRPQSDPRETVSGFFDAVIAEDYEKAYGLLDGYSSLGLESELESDLSQQMFDALRRSYAYRLDGDCTMNKTSAQQKVLLRHLDFSAMQADLRQATEDALAEEVQRLPRSELYDENGAYLPEVTATAYQKALSSLLARADDYMTVDALTLELRYDGEIWRLGVDSALTTALSGVPSAKGGA